MATNNTSPYSFASFVGFINRNFGVLLFIGISFLAGFFVGSLWTQNQMLQGGQSGRQVAVDNTAPTAGGEAPTPARVDQVPAITEDDHVRGSRSAKIFLVEYSDFECPFCARFHPTMEQVMQEYGDDVAWVYRHFPLSNHPNAQKAGEASECVAEQGGDEAFWKFTDAAFEETAVAGRLSDEAINEAAQSAGVNMEVFQSCLESGKYTDKVQEQARGGATAGITGTPGTIVLTEQGGQEVIAGALPFEQVQVVIDAYLN